MLCNGFWGRGGGDIRERKESQNSEQVLLGYRLQMTSCAFDFLNPPASC